MSFVRIYKASIERRIVCTTDLYNNAKISFKPYITWNTGTIVEFPSQYTIQPSFI